MRIKALKGQFYAQAKYLTSSRYFIVLVLFLCFCTLFLCVFVCTSVQPFSGTHCLVLQPDISNFEGVPGPSFCVMAVAFWLYLFRENPILTQFSRNWISVPSLTGFCQLRVDGTAQHLLILKGNKLDCFAICCKFPWLTVPQATQSALT